MHMYNFLCSDSLLYTSFLFFLHVLYIVFIHVIVHAHEVTNTTYISQSYFVYAYERFERIRFKLIYLKVTIIYGYKF